MSFENYSLVRSELIAQLRPEHTTVTVPSCPAWTVKDVVAHLSGLVAEKLGDVEGSLGSDEATSRQVGDRADLSLDEVIEEWSSNMGAFETVAIRDVDFAGALAADLVVHVFDVAEVVSLTTEAAAAATPASAHRYVPRLQSRASERLGLAVDVELTDGTRWPADGAGPQRITLRATPHDFLRSVTGRRTRAEVEALDWSEDPGHLLDSAWNQYGPFRTDAI